MMIKLFSNKCRKILHESRRKILLWNMELIKTKAFNQTLVFIFSIARILDVARISIFSLLLLCIVILFISTSFLCNDSITGIIAAIIGTVLALVFTLSVIPIQKAVTDWSASISRLYIKDKGVAWAFILISLLLVCTLLLPNKNHISPALSIFFLAVSLDIVRWYYIHICRLLDPNVAIKKLEIEIIASINKYRRIVEKTAARFRLIVPYEKTAEVDRASIEKVVYAQTSNYISRIKLDLDSIAEFSLKALANNDSILVGVSLSSISKVIEFYASIRKDNLFFNRSPDTLFLVQETDADSLFNHAYDLLKKVGLAAVSKPDESVCESVFKEFCVIAEYISSLNDETSFMVSPLLSYMRDVVLACIQKRMFDAPYSAGLKLCRLANNIPESARYESTYQPIMELLQSIMLYYIVLEKSVITNELSKSISVFLMNLYNKSYWQFNDVLKIILGMYSTIVYSVLKIGKEGFQGLVFQTAITNGYATISERSLCRLVLLIAEADVEKQAGAGDDPKNRNDMRDVLGVAELLTDHFRELAKDSDFGSNRMLRDILECMFDTLKVFVWYAAMQDEDNRDIIVKKMITPFFWIIPSYFADKKNIDADFERQATNAIAHVALICVGFEWNRHDIFESASKVIRKIIDNHCRVIGVGNGYSVVYFLEILWRLRFVAEKYGMTAVMGSIDQLIVGRPDSITEENWNWCQEHLEKKKSNLLRYIDEDDSRFPHAIDSSLDAFMDALRSRI
ncbi:MAG: hypothetical protein ABI597_04550 [Gammaproteobacteria bacterium]